MSLAENLELQLSELDMLRSMFPGDGEIVLDDPVSEADAREWLDGGGGGDIPCSRLCFSVRLTPSPGEAVTVRVEMGRDYPAEAGQLDLQVSSDRLTRESQARLNRDLKAEAAKAEAGELAVGILLQWVRDRWSGCDKRKEAEEVTSAKSKESPAKTKRDTFCRLWIYSHHIYSKTKRKDILSLAPDHDLTGFCMPGKPGIACLEGTAGNCADAWGVIKSWNWKKINVKIQEEEEDGEIDSHRRFPGFEELALVKAGGETRDYHMDMGEFYEYLRRHDSGYMFKELFGIDKEAAGGGTS